MVPEAPDCSRVNKEQVRGGHRGEGRAHVQQAGLEATGEIATLGVGLRADPQELVDRGP